MSQSGWGCALMYCSTVSNSCATAQAAASPIGQETPVPLIEQ